MKWNASGNVLISLDALERFVNDSSLHKSSKAIEYGGRRGARCFVAEHVYPTKELQNLVLQMFSKKNPTKEEFVRFFRTYNCICYIWHEEDMKLNTLGLRSTLPKAALSSDVYSRYTQAGINHIQTNFKDGRLLFKSLHQYRDEGLGCSDISKILMEELVK